MNDMSITIGNIHHRTEGVEYPSRRQFMDSICKELCCGEPHDRAHRPGSGNNMCNSSRGLSHICFDYAVGYFHRLSLC